MQKLQKYVAQHYLASGHYRPDAEELLQLRAWLARKWEFVNRSYDVQFVPYDPYKTAQELWAAEGKLYISGLHNNQSCSIWTPDENLKLRAVHDLDHILGRHDFSFEGEYAACKAGIKGTERHESFVRQVLFSEVAAQAAVFYETGRFVDCQKLVIGWNLEVGVGTFAEAVY